MTGRRLRPRPHTGWSDERLVRVCLKGDDDAWAALVDKYKRLIYSIAVRYGAPREDCADIFQFVCLELFSRLSELRTAAALRGWIITVTAHQSFRWKRQHQKRADRERSDTEAEDPLVDPVVTSDVPDEAAREQQLRDAMSRLSPRCQEMVRLLFFVEPPLPYKEVAHRLGLAVGSIGFIRGRCLKHLAKTLRGAGF